MPRLRALACALIAVAAVPAHAEPAQAEWKAELAQIMADPAWIGPPVEAPYFSLDGQRIVFSLKRAGSALSDPWLVPVRGGAMRRVDDAELETLDAPRPVFDTARRRALMIRDGDVFLRELGGGKLRQLTRTPEQEDQPRFAADGRSAVWRVGNRWYRHDFSSGLSAPLAELKTEKDPQAAPAPDDLRDRQLRLIATLAREKQRREEVSARQRELQAKLASRAPGPVYLGDKLSLVDTALSPDARWLLVVTEAAGTDKGRVGKLPRYVTESGYEEAEDQRTRVGRNPPLPEALRLVDLADGTQRELALDDLPGIKDDPLAELRAKAGAKPLEGPRGVKVIGMRWNADGSRAAVMLRAIDNKDRWIATLDPREGKLVVQHRLTDPAWITDGPSGNYTFNEFDWLPDGSLWYLSEESGFVHLHAQHPGQASRALTSGRWEASRVAWSPDGRRAYFLCNRRWPGDYEVCTVSRDGGEIRELTTLDGVHEFVLSPDGRQLAVVYSEHHTPPQLALVPSAGGAAKRLTDTRSAEYKSRSFMEPQYVQVPSKHGAGVIWGKFYRPAKLESGRRYPIVLFVHGAGELQNVSHRWPPYFREQMFHELLVKHGYLVLDLDYRGSAGYGRDWRSAIYRQMGHPELEDYLDGIDWLVETQQGDRARVGIYGGSYGGFMTFMALFRAPDAFRAGAALRPVTDWSQYNHEYTSNILNTPDIDPEAFKRSSPIEYAEGLRGRLLISHGMLDDNVFYQDSVRLAQRLIELRKDGWELASYPLERHGYVHPESWYDQYRRIFELFQSSL